MGTLEHVHYILTVSILIAFVYNSLPSTFMPVLSSFHYHYERGEDEFKEDYWLTEDEESKDYEEIVEKIECIIHSIFN